MVDGTDGQQIERVRKVVEHSNRGEQLIKDVFDWFEEHRWLRKNVNIVQMRQE